MKQELKKELKEWFDKIEQRDNHIKGLLKTEKLFYPIKEEDIEKGISKIAFNLLNKKKWNFEKDRLSGDQLSYEDGRLQMRQYRCHNSHYIYFLTDLSQAASWLGEGFQYGVQQIKDILKEYNSKKDKFRSESSHYSYRRKRYYSGYQKVELISEKIESKFEIVSGYKENGIEIVDDVNVTLSSDIDGNADVSYDNSQLLCYDEVYNKVLDVISRLKQMSIKAKEDYDNTMKQLNEMLEADTFNTMMVMIEI